MNIKKHIPNAITCCNLLSGCLSIYFSLGPKCILCASIFIIISAIFDFFDGLFARLLGVSSPIGKDLDSLADVVSFGVAPSMLLYSSLCNVYSPLIEKEYMFMFVFLIGAFAALRLAKFNNDTRQTNSFIGLPVPANALFWIGYSNCLINHKSEIYNYYGIVFVLTFIVVLLLSYLMISELPMFSLKISKEKDFSHYIVPIILVFLSVILMFYMVLSSFVIIIPLYIVLCVIKKMCRK